MAIMWWVAADTVDRNIRCWADRQSYVVSTGSDEVGCDEYGSFGHLGLCNLHRKEIVPTEETCPEQPE